MQTSSTGCECIVLKIVFILKEVYYGSLQFFSQHTFGVYVLNTDSSILSLVNKVKYNYNPGTYAIIMILNNKWL